MPDPSGFSRICSACGRRVPRSVATCRCGTVLPFDSAREHARVAQDKLVLAGDGTRKGGSPLVAVVILVATLGAGVAYWMNMSAPAPVAGNVPGTAEPAAPAAAGAEPRSADARAWDAAANATRDDARDASAPDSPRAAAPTGAASIEEMVDAAMPAVVLIEATSGRGSGFFVRHDTLITNVHVVQNDGYVTLRKHDGSAVSARVESRAPAYDIAILKVAQPSASQAVIAIGSARTLRPGQEIIVIGSALGTLQNSVSRGVMSGLRNAGGATLVQTDAASNPGNSGGPMLDRNGRAIGITTLSYKNAEGLNFGVAIDHAQELMEGRLTSLGSSGGLSNIQAQSRGSESDRRQQQGDEQLRAQIGQLANAARQIDASWQRFRQQCYTSPIAGNYQREWLAVVVPGGIPGDAAAGCVSYYQALEADIREFRGLMQRLLNDARRAGVLPDTVRETLRVNRLEFEWDQ